MRGPTIRHHSGPSAPRGASRRGGVAFPHAFARDTADVERIAARPGLYWNWRPRDGEDADWWPYMLMPADPTAPRSTWGRAWHAGVDTWLSDDQMAGTYLEGPVAPPPRPDGRVRALIDEMPKRRR